LKFGKLSGKYLAFEAGGMLLKDDKRMEATTSLAIPQYLGRCVSTNVVVRVPCSIIGVYV
jgi:hypothetical protein